MAYSPLMPANFSRVPVSVRAGGPASVSHCFVLQKNKKMLGTPAKMLLAYLENKYAWAAQARKEVAPQPRGHLTTRRQLPTASTNAYRLAGDICMAGTLVFRGRLHRILVIDIAQVQELAGGRERSALVSARRKGCSYDAECSANYTADVYTLLCANHRSLRKK